MKEAELVGFRVWVLWVFFNFVGSRQFFLEGIIVCGKKGLEIFGILGLCQQLRVEGEEKAFG